MRIGMDNRTQAQVLDGLRLGERVVTSVAAPASPQAGSAAGPDGTPPP